MCLIRFVNFVPMATSIVMRTQWPQLYALLQKLNVPKTFWPQPRDANFY